MPILRLDAVQRYYGLGLVCPVCGVGQIVLRFDILNRAAIGIAWNCEKNPTTDFGTIQYDSSQGSTPQVLLSPGDFVSPVIMTPNFDASGKLLTVSWVDTQTPTPASDVIQMGKRDKSSKQPSSLGDPTGATTPSSPLLDIFSFFTDAKKRKTRTTSTDYDLDDTAIRVIAGPQNNDGSSSPQRGRSGPGSDGFNWDPSLVAQAMSKCLQLVTGAPPGLYSIDPVGDSSSATSFQVFQQVNTLKMDTFTAMTRYINNDPWTVPAALLPKLNAQAGSSILKQINGGGFDDAVYYIPNNDSNPPTGGTGTIIGRSATGSDFGGLRIGASYNPLGGSDPALSTSHWIQVVGSPQKARLLEVNGGNGNLIFGPDSAGLFWMMDNGGSALDPFYDTVKSDGVAPGTKGSGTRRYFIDTPLTTKKQTLTIFGLFLGWWVDQNGNPSASSVAQTIYIFPKDATDYNSWPDYVVFDSTQNISHVSTKPAQVQANDPSGVLKDVYVYFPALTQGQSLLAVVAADAGSLLALASDSGYSSQQGVIPRPKPKNILPIGISQRGWVYEYITDISSTITGNLSVGIAIGKAFDKNPLGTTNNANFIDVWKSFANPKIPVPVGTTL